MTKEIKLTENEQIVFDCMVENDSMNDGFILDELKCYKNPFTMNELKGYASSLAKKDLIVMYNGECYNDGMVKVE